jgi:hypothetical protein
MQEGVRKPLSEMISETRKIEAESGIGLACQKCGCRDTRVITTWHSSDGSETKRTRVCRHCGQHLTSREVFF